jgi:hypothetical protein
MIGLFCSLSKLLQKKLRGAGNCGLLPEKLREGCGAGRDCVGKFSMCGMQEEGLEVTGDSGFHDQQVFGERGSGRNDLPYSRIKSCQAPPLELGHGQKIGVRYLPVA